MKFIGALVAAVCAIPAVLADQYKVTWDTAYDNATNSMEIVACSGTLASDGYTPLVLSRASPTLAVLLLSRYDSPYCVTCWELTYEDTSINIFAIDTAFEGFNIAKEAFDVLTDHQEHPVNATATQVP